MVFSNDPFIIITGPTDGNATGSSAASYTVASHSSTGIISVAGQSFTATQGAAFTDVPPTHQFYNELGKLSARSITMGGGGGNFCPAPTWHAR
jgi:hypothetical protein